MADGVRGPAVPDGQPDIREVDAAEVGAGGKCRRFRPLVHTRHSHLPGNVVR